MLLLLNVGLPEAHEQVRVLRCTQRREPLFIGVKARIMIDERTPYILSAGLLIKVRIALRSTETRYLVIHVAHHVGALGPGAALLLARGLPMGPGVHPGTRDVGLSLVDGGSRWHVHC